MSDREHLHVLVSGGSRGLGAAICERLLERGHAVTAFARSATDDARRLAERHGDRFSFAEVDATDYDAVAALVREAESARGPIGALVNNAAIGQDSLLAHTSVEQLQQVVRVNLEAPIVLTRLVVRGMLRSGVQGRIVTIGSIGARQGYPGLTAYAATKGALESFTRALARECAGRITATVVAPGFFESEMSSVLRPEQQQAIVRRTPTGRLTTVDDVVPLVELLVEGRYNLNATVIDVEGGALA